MPKLYETPAETMLRVERQNIASTGQATPTPVTGSISANTNLPSGFGSDATGRIFKMPVSPAPASALPAQNTAPTQQSTQGASPSSAAAETPAGRVYSNLVTPEDSALAAAYAAREKQILDAQSPADEQSIRDKTMARFQAEIDSLNQFYAQKKAEALAREAPLAAGRLGTNRAIQARRGLLGGTFGEAETSRTNEYNRSVEQNIADTINVERDRALSAILGKAQSQAQEEITAKQKARDESYQAHIDFLKGKAERKEARVNSLVSNLVGSGSNLSDVDFASDDMKKTASDLGISVEALKARYDDAKRGYESANAVQQIKLNKDRYTQVGNSLVDLSTGNAVYTSPEKVSKPQSVLEYEYAKQNGYAGSYSQYQNEDANRKARASGSGGSSAAPSYFTRPKSDGSIGYYFGSPKNPGGAQEISSKAYLEGSSKASGVLNPQSENKFLDTGYIKKVVDKSTLEQAAKDAGFSTGGSFGFGATGDVDKYLESLTPTIEAYRSAGYTDKEIEKMMGL